MKVSRAKLKNFGKFEEFECHFGNEVTRLIGVNGSGKSTIGLKGLVACLNGISEKSSNGQLVGERFRFIGKNGKSADLEYEFVDESTGDKFVIRNHLTTTKNDITFKMLSDNPINDDWLKGFLNVALMSAKNFCSLSGREQAVALGIDTSTFDKEMKSAKEEYSLINRELKGINVPEPVDPVERIEITDLLRKKGEIKTKLNNLYKENRAKNEQLRREYDQKCTEVDEEYERFMSEQNEKYLTIKSAAEHLDVLINLGYKGLEVHHWIDGLPKPEEREKPVLPEPQYIEEMPNDTELVEIDKQIIEATDTNAKAEKYRVYSELVARREAKLAELENNKKEQAEIEKARVTYINSFKFPFSGLTTDEEGSLLLNSRPVTDQYYSKGELEVIVARLHASVNPVFKTRFIDDFDLLDEENQEKLLAELTGAGFQVITAEVRNTKQDTENVLILRECKLVTGEDEGKLALI